MIEVKKQLNISLPTKNPSNVDNVDYLRKRMEGGISKVHSSFGQKENISEKNESVIEVDLNLLQDNPYQPRRSYNEESIIELAMSIKSEGLLQPITVSKNEIGQFIINYGHRRVRACRKLGVKTIKAIIISHEANKLRTKALIENIQRDDMHSIEIAISFASALKSGDFESQSELADIIGKDRSYVSKILKLLTLPETVKKDLIENKSVNDKFILDLIRRIEDPIKCEKIYFWCVAEKPSRKEVEEKIRELTIKKEEVLTKVEFSISKTKDGFKIKLTNIADDKMQEIEKMIKKYISNN